MFFGRACVENKAPMAKETRVFPSNILFAASHPPKADVMLALFHPPASAQPGVKYTPKEVIHTCIRAPSNHKLPNCSDPSCRSIVLRPSCTILFVCACMLLPPPPPAPRQNTGARRKNRRRGHFRCPGERGRSPAPPDPKQHGVRNRQDDVAVGNTHVELRNPGQLHGRQLVQGRRGVGALARRLDVVVVRELSRGGREGRRGRADEEAVRAAAERSVSRFFPSPPPFERSVTYHKGQKGGCMCV